MMFACDSKVLFYIIFTLVSVCFAYVPQTDYDVIIIGGGPSGLSAASALSRVLRKVVLFDSGKYRNRVTRHMHDVIGNDHVEPPVFRAAARKQIAFYNVTTFVDQEVIKLENLDKDGFRATTSNGSYTARKVILGSGVKDDLPDTPGLQEAFGKGIFWCPWCDGFEHRNQSMGVLGELSDAFSSVKELHPTLNKDLRVYSNGTNTTAQRAKLDEKYKGWKKVFQTYNVTINNKPILNITRVQDGATNFNGATRQEFDLFRIYFRDNSSELRGAFIANYNTSQASDLPAQLGVGMLGSKMNTTGRGLETTVAGVYGVGDANSENTTNVPHAMSSGKKAAVFAHVKMAGEELDRDIGASKRAADLDERSLHKNAEKDMGNEIMDLYRKLRRNIK